MIKYTYAKLCDSGRLHEEISASAITVAQDHIETAPGQTDVWMRAELSANEITILNAIIAAHVAEPLPDYQSKPVIVEALPPFAEPLYRTKLDAVTSPVTIQPGEQGNIDYTMPSERWLYGGEGLVVGAEPGDWFEAMVVDDLGLIPAPYRAAMCEPVPGWPVINTYVPKQYMLVPGAGQNSMFKINTYPLIAKVTPGLVLRTVYHATSAGGPRTVYTNLMMTIKL